MKWTLILHVHPTYIQYLCTNALLMTCTVQTVYQNGRLKVYVTSNRFKQFNPLLPRTDFSEKKREKNSEATLLDKFWNGSMVIHCGLLKVVVHANCGLTTVRMVQEETAMIAQWDCGPVGSTVRPWWHVRLFLISSTVYMHCCLLFTFTCCNCSCTWNGRLINLIEVNYHKLSITVCLFLSNKLSFQIKRFIKPSSLSPHNQNYKWQKKSNWSFQ